MRIIQLHSEHVKKVKAVDITPTDDLVIISGRNANGKSSVLDSIWLALEYRAAIKEIPQPLRKGETDGIITIDLGDYIVTRKFTEDDSTLSIKTPDGEKVSSPQKLLDGMIGDLSFDPWEFARKDEQQQRTILSDLIFKLSNGKINLAEFDAKKQEAYDSRTDANRERKRLASLLANIRPPVDQDPQEEVSSSELTEAISNAVDNNQRIKTLQDRISNDAKKALDAQAEITRLQRLIDECALSIRASEEDLASLEPQDIGFLKSQLNGLEETNKRAREVVEYKKYREALASVDADIEKLNAKMELIEIEKAEALESSPLPVKGLIVNAEGVRMLNEEGHEIPICQASKAQKLRISTAIAMAANPQLRVIRIEDGSLLDDEGMQILKEMARDKDYQVWIEYMSRNDQDRMGIYIEDGKVA